MDIIHLLKMDIICLLKLESDEGDFLESASAKAGVLQVVEAFFVPL